MTKREAIEKCKEHWLWVSEGKLRGKHDYAGIEEAYGHCWACEYNYQHDDGYTYCGSDCIIPWTGGHCVFVIDGGALVSEYSAWSSAYTADDAKAAKAAALAIVDLCDQALAALALKELV